MKSTEEAIAENVAKALEDGPRLRGDYNTPILARADGAVLVGGLGGFGVGCMWSETQPHHTTRPSYAEAPIDPTRRDSFGNTAEDHLTRMREWRASRP